MAPPVDANDMMRGESVTHPQTRIEGRPASAHGLIRIVALTTTEMWSLTIDSRFIEDTETQRQSLEDQGR